MRSRNVTNIAASVSCAEPSAAAEAAGSVRRQCLHTAAKSYRQWSDGSWFPLSEEQLGITANTTGSGSNVRSPPCWGPVVVAMQFQRPQLSTVSFCSILLQIVLTSRRIWWRVASALRLVSCDDYMWPSRDRSKEPGTLKHFVLRLWRKHFLKWREFACTPSRLMSAVWNCNKYKSMTWVNPKTGNTNTVLYRQEQL